MSVVSPRVRYVLILAGTLVVSLTALARQPAVPITVDLSLETVGRAPVAFEPMVGTWIVGEDAGEKVIVVDGRPWVASNDTENNVALWEFHNGVRRAVKRGREREWMLDRAAWHELKMTVSGADFKAFMDGKPALEYTLGSEPGPGRNNAPPNPDLFPANNPVLRPPVTGKVGLWSKTDSTSYFKDFTIGSM